MAQIVTLQDRINGFETIYPVTTPKAVIDSTTGQTQEELNLKFSNEIEDLLANGYCECTTVAGSATKLVQNPGFKLNSKCRLLVKMQYANIASNVVLNVNGTGNKPLYYNGYPVSNENSWKAGETVDIYYDGTAFYALNVNGSTDASSTYILNWNTDVATTRRQVLEDKRKQGLQVSYKNDNTAWTIEMYVGTALTDSEWAKSENWQRIAMGKEVENILELRGKTSGIATLDENGHLVPSQLHDRYKPYITTIFDAYVDITAPNGKISSDDEYAELGNIGDAAKLGRPVFIIITKPDSFLQKIKAVCPVAPFYNANDDSCIGFNIIDGNDFYTARLSGPRAWSITSLSNYYLTYDVANKRSAIVNANLLLGRTEAFNTGIAEVVSALLSAGHDFIKYAGVIVTFLGKDGWQTKQFKGANVTTDFSDADKWENYGGASVGGVYNATVEVPLQGGYYTLVDTQNQAISAVHVAWNKKKAMAGLILSYEAGAGAWKTYQYVGKTVTEDNWINPDNWKDFGSLAAGSEPFIIIDELCGPPAMGFYTLDSAVTALINYQNEINVVYAKTGLIISYRTGENEMECKQFQGAVTDFNESALWKDFGGGGTELIANDTPSDGGTDAFSTGGAYKHIPYGAKVDEETPGVVKLQLVNEAEEVIGNEIVFGVGTGTGSGASTIVTIVCQETPLYRPVGGQFVINMSVRSITKDSSGETSNAIRTIELIDRSTNVVLQTIRPNTSSSASATDYKFSIDVSQYFTEAASRDFRIRATDDGDFTGTRNISVVAVDVTATTVQTLNYTENTSVLVGGNAKSIPMYKFAKNASDKGIRAQAQILVNGTWRDLLDQVITDTFSHNLSIDPVALGLTHGAYAIKIWGTDVVSGVTGNTLYTSVFCIDRSNNNPLVAMRWSDASNGTIKLYEEATFDVAAYNPNGISSQVYVKATNSETGLTGDVLASPLTALNGTTYQIKRKLQNYKQDGSVTLSFFAQTGTATAPLACELRIVGSLIDAAMVAGDTLAMQFQDRSNADADKTIRDAYGNVLIITGANYSTNGFVKDSFGTAMYGTEADTGIMALRIAEDVIGELDYKPYADSAIEQNGGAFHLSFMAKNIANDNAVLAHCMGANGIGWYIDGKEIVFTVDGAGFEVLPDGTITFGTITGTSGETVNKVPIVASTIRTAYKAGERCDVDIVIEPTGVAPYAGIGVCKMYVNGELVGACYYRAQSFATHQQTVKFSGVHGDLYIYNIYAWKQYYNFEQAFSNYLLMMSDTEAMIAEHKFNQVMGSVVAESTTKNRPLKDKLYDAGIMYFVVTKNANTPDNEAKDNYPDYLETLDGDKKTTRILDIYCYFPDRPWQNCWIEGVPVSNQGTTSSYRPIKNIKFKLKKDPDKGINPVIHLLTKEEDFTTELEKAKWREAKSYADDNKIQVKPNSLPTRIVTVKVDYSESGGANNGASTNLFNDLQRTLGENYITPAQSAYTGQYELNTSIASIPCAFFRTDKHSTDATDPANGYFHAKGNWNEDKGDAAVFGFEKVPGYNKNCVNYGDFIEHVAARDQDFDAFDDSLDKSDWDKTALHMLSEFCGPKTRFYRWQNDTWENTTGAMQWDGTKWVVTGDVLNPVDNFELLKYDNMDWFQSIDADGNYTNDVLGNMLAIGASGDRKWLEYFESRYPDDDDLNDLYADGKKVPYSLYRWLKFCQDCNHNLNETHGNITLDGRTVAGTKANRLLKWKHELHQYCNVHSAICYHVFTDYIAAVDQRAKNMMIGSYLEKNGTNRMYLNHLYDGDTILGADNDCGRTISAYVDPNNDTGVYQGHDSVLFNQIANSDYIWLSNYTSDSDTLDSAKTTTVARVANAMRNATMADGLKPFSYDGLYKYWITDRLAKWQKLTSSFDGDRKYIQHSTADENYFYALHGLGLQFTPDFIQKRFEFRDGYYQTGAMFASAFSMRATGDPKITVKITAAKAGFFGLGVDRADSTVANAYLQEGESVTFEEAGQLGSGKMIYLFGANKVAELDISGATPSSSSWNISELVLLRRLIIGGEDYQMSHNENGYLQILNLGNRPFLEELDVQNTKVTNIDATYCPRMQKILAKDSELSACTLAETSKISILTVPNTMQSLQFVNIPVLHYNALNQTSGLVASSWQNVQRVYINNAPNINATKLLQDIMSTQSTTVLANVRIANQPMSGNGSELIAMIDKGVGGISIDGKNTSKPAIAGVYNLTTILDETDMYKILQGVDEIELVASLLAYQNFFDEEINCEYYSNTPEVDTVTLENLSEHILYYNGETADEYALSWAEDQRDVNSLIP